MKHFILNGTIDETLVQKFIDLVSSAGDEKITIYLTSSGGADAGMYVMRNIINSYPSDFILHAVESIYSCAFELFFTAKCKRIIAPGTIGMYHQSTVEMRMQMNGKPYYDSDKERIKDGIYDNKELIGFMYSIGADVSIVRKMMKGEDVYFQTEVLKQFLAYEPGQPPINTKRIFSEGKSRKNSKLVCRTETASSPNTDTALQADQ